MPPYNYDSKLSRFRWKLINLWGFPLGVNWEYDTIVNKALDVLEQNPEKAHFFNPLPLTNKKYTSLELFDGLCINATQYGTVYVLTGKPDKITTSDIYDIDSDSWRVARGTQTRVGRLYKKVAVGQSKKDPHRTAIDQMNIDLNRYLINPTNEGKDEDQ